MNGIMNENQLAFVKEYKFDNPLFHKMTSIIDKCYRDCHTNHFHTFEYRCIHKIIFTNITNNEKINFTISDKSMGSYELNKKLTVARQNGFTFNQINKLTIKIYSNLSHINIHYYLKLQISLMHRHFFRKLPQNREYIQTFCNDRRNIFQFACRQWYSYNNPQCAMA